MAWDCDKRVADIFEYSECEEHPFTILVDVLKCLQARGGEYVIKLPAGVVPLNVLSEYLKFYGAQCEVRRETVVRELAGKQIAVDVEVFVLRRA